MGDKEVCQWFEVCPLKRFYEQRKLNPVRDKTPEASDDCLWQPISNGVNKKWIENYCWGDYSKCARYKMEDEGMYHPDNMMPDGTTDEKLK
ncbi:MAG: uracil-DNA glycosylase [Candidatus Omnitrophica bacterium]|nr:uracil-DNA glycosylase [Candidatus Omnitrophota bacterium]